MLIGISEQTLYPYLLGQFALDRDLPTVGADDLATTIKIFADHIMDVLIDHYDLDPEDGARNVCATCISCYKNADNISFCKEHDYMGVDDLDGCSSWEGRY